MRCCWLLLLFVGSVTASGAETCQSYRTRIKTSRFREGKWFDQVRIYSGHQDYVSQHHPDDVASMFLAKYKTNCGFFELERHSDGAIELFKGYDVPRFDAQFFTFKAQISRIDGGGFRCKMFLDQRECRNYGNLSRTITVINILSTDYSTFMIIHQCIEGRHYLMVLTKQQQLRQQEKIRLGNFMIDVMKERAIVIDNETFWWPTTDLCDKHVSETYPTFYYHIYFDKVQAVCPTNLPTELIDLTEWLKHRTEADEELQRIRKQALIVSGIAFVGVILVVCLVWVINDNYKF